MEDVCLFLVLITAYINISQWFDMLKIIIMDPLINTIHL